MKVSLSYTDLGQVYIRGSVRRKVFLSPDMK